MRGLRGYRYRNTVQLSNGTNLEYGYHTLPVDEFWSRKPLTPERFAWLVSADGKRIAGSLELNESPWWQPATLEACRSALAHVIWQENRNSWGTPLLPAEKNSLKRLRKLGL
jgi:hypothetical protein